MRGTKMVLAAGALALALAPPASAQVGPIPRGDIAIELQSVATGLGAPNYLTTAGDGSNRLFVVDQVGLLRVIQDGQLLPTPMLDVSSQLLPSGFNPNNPNDERGFLGVAFHPGFSDPASPGYRTVYTYTSEGVAGNPLTFPVPQEPTMGGGLNNYVNVVTEWRVSATDPNLIDPSSRRVVMTIGKDASNHNGGTIAFGPDGYLYLGTGDGGNANDRGRGHQEPLGNAQQLNTVLGKFLRIDPLAPSVTPGSADPVSDNGRYRNPADNPFTGPGDLREIYAYGLRNPFRWSFDTLTGQLIVGDVGQGNIEEIDRIVRGGNYGWAFKEGDFLFNRLTGAISTRDPLPGLIDPISGPLGVLEYDHTQGNAIIGGFVYRGSALPELYGKYVFADLGGFPPRQEGRLFYADLETGEIKEFILGLDNRTLGLRVLGFGQDDDGELYVLTSSFNGPPSGDAGGVFRIVPAVPEPSTLALLGAGGLGLAGGGWWCRRRKAVTA